MAVGRRPGGDPADLERHHVRRLGLRAEGRHDRLQRAHPAQGARLRRGRAPAHRFRPGKAPDDGRQDLGQHVQRLAAGFFDHREIEFALLGVGDGLGLVEARQPGTAQEALHRGLGRADLRSAPLLANRLAARRETGDMQREASRRREGLRAVVEEPALDEGVGHEFLQILGRTPLHACRDFFGAEFEQQIGHGRGNSRPLRVRRDDAGEDARNAVGDGPRASGLTAASPTGWSRDPTGPSSTRGHRRSASGRSRARGRNGGPEGCRCGTSPAPPRVDRRRRRP